MTEDYKIQYIPIDDIKVDEESFNCRKTINETEILKLASSIKESGLINPITVMPSEDASHPYKLIAGFRRYRATQHLGSDKIACIVREQLSAIEAVQINAIENLSRENLSYLEEAQIVDRLTSEAEKDGRVLTRKDIQGILGQSHGWVDDRMMLLSLEPEIRDTVFDESGEAKISLLNIREIKRVRRKEGFDAALNAAKATVDHRKKSKGLVKVTDVISKKKKSEIKKIRKKQEMDHMNDVIISNTEDNIGTSATKGIAWCRGEISSKDLIETVAQDLEDLGYAFDREAALDAVEESG